MDDRRRSLFAAFNVRTSFDLGLYVAIVVALSGISTAAVAYLLAERIMRSVAARALASGVPDRVAVRSVTVRALFAWALGTGVPVLGLILVAVSALSWGQASSDELAITIFVLGGIALVIGLLAEFVAAKASSDPIKSGAQGAAGGRERATSTCEVPVYDGTQIGQLQAGFNRMVAGLREREEIRDLFGRHVGEDVARAALGRGVELGGEVRDVAVLFVDLIGSTTLAANRPPDEVVDMLNQFFAVVVDVVTEHGGWVNKFEGDAALAIWGAPGAGGGPRHEDPGRGADHGRAARARAARAERRDRGVGRGGRCGERRSGAPLRVHGDRRPGQRGGAADRGRQERPRQGGGERRPARAGLGPEEAARWEVHDEVRCSAGGPRRHGSRSRGEVPWRRDSRRRTQRRLTPTSPIRPRTSCPMTRAARRPSCARRPSASTPSRACCRSPAGSAAGCPATRTSATCSRPPATARWRCSGARSRALQPDRPSVAHEIGLGALQVWQSLSESAGRGRGTKEVALLFTDLVDFSSWALKAGDEATLDLLRQVGTAIETAVTECDGTIVKRLGDGVMAAFRHPQDAVDAALEAHRRLESVEVDGYKPRMRAGVHHGKPRRIGGDYLGVDVNIAARVGEAAKAGQVLVSEPAFDMLDPKRVTGGRSKALRASGAPKGLRVRAVQPAA